MGLVLVTGASGFVGRFICGPLLSSGFRVRAAFRAASGTELGLPGLEREVVGEVNSKTDWSSPLAQVDCVIHCAARTQGMHEASDDALAAYRVVNVDGSRRLAEQAAAAGVRRFVYLSSIKVQVEQTQLGEPVFFSDTPAPQDAYGTSKWEAERALWEVAGKTGLELVVVRPPLIYGPGVKGNLARLLRLVRLGCPLPLGSLRNKRSFIGLDNLADLLVRCIDHPAAAGQTLLVADGEDLSTPDLLHLMASAMGCSARLFPVPVALLKLAGSCVGRRAEICRLVGSLQIDSSHARQLLDWNPSVSVQEGVRRMVRGT